ncbi:hypothetical protein ACJIZ3_011453 [Penstemon smallii]|uniref:Transposase Tnp1/En/Spm-like domain-containing protein n=1 Tax=Penstemon smallii TaxID=265156 RepID=A0ABD3ULD3_9LAMI
MISEYEESMAKMKESLEELKAEIARMKQTAHPSTPHENLGTQQTSDKQCSYWTSTNVNDQTLQVGDDVLIKSKLDASKIVATGYVYGIDPSLEIAKQCLGPNWCEVNIQVAIESGEKLLRPHSNLKTIGDAYGSNIAWPCQLVERFDLFA